MVSLFATTRSPISRASAKGPVTSRARPPTKYCRRRSRDGAIGKSGSSRRAHGAIADQLLDRCLAVAEFAQHLAGMLADARRRSADRGLVDRKSCRGLGLPHPSNPRLLELRNDPACDHLLVVDDLAAPQDRRAGHVGRIETLEPFGRSMPRDIFLHLVD